MQAIKNAITWLIESEQPEDAMLRHLGLRYGSGLRFMPVSQASRYNLPVFVFFKADGVFTRKEIDAVRRLFEDIGIVAEMNGEGKNSYSVTINLVANTSIVRAYENFMAGINEHGLRTEGWDSVGVNKLVLPEGWSW
jgi:hypothetical protein